MKLPANKPKYKKIIHMVVSYYNVTLRQFEDNLIITAWLKQKVMANQIRLNCRISNLAFHPRWTHFLIEGRPILSKRNVPRAFIGRSTSWWYVVLKPWSHPMFAKESTTWLLSRKQWEIATKLDENFRRYLTSV